MIEPCMRDGRDRSKRTEELLWGVRPKIKNRNLQRREERAFQAEGTVWAKAR